MLETTRVETELKAHGRLL